ncbi:putative defense protein Hdd11-like [Diprion similis]|uniref:putative defense protein Hdd11-like n=1 Tax=Diprion similis TaxID=362088 RepID=UPI001EF98917|nr:putative defense protein Hdd11-like [Diprion similis]XP_046737771.1 putative defense protein Hdd11-like [Diprion similis]
MFRFLIFVGSIVAVTYAYSVGAPAHVCETMMPGHGVDPQTTPSPYDILLSKNSILGGESVTVTVKGHDQELFKGILIQARLGDQIVGTFDVDPADTKVKTIDCPKGERNAVTHKNAKNKSEVSVKWVAPADLVGNVVFKVTVVKEAIIFWVAQSSSTLSVRRQ